MPVDGGTDDRFGEFCGWLTRSQPDLRRLAGRLTSNATDAADLAQATTLRALEKRRLFVSGSLNELKKWLTRIMFNLHYERLRGAVREVLADWLDEVPASCEPPPPLWLTVGDEEIAAAVAQLDVGRAGRHRADAGGAHEGGGARPAGRHELRVRCPVEVVAVDHVRHADP